MLVGFRRVLPGLGRFPMCMYFFLATASHGLLDAMTDGGLGVAFFVPFDKHRYFLPWTPIRVSPIGVGRFFTDRGFGCPPERTPLDLASGGAAGTFGLADAPASCAFHVAWKVTPVSRRRSTEPVTALLLFP